MRNVTDVAALRNVVEPLARVDLVANKTKCFEPARRAATSPPVQHVHLKSAELSSGVHGACRPLAVLPGVEAPMIGRPTPGADRNSRSRTHSFRRAVPTAFASFSFHCLPPPPVRQTDVQCADIDDPFDETGGNGTSDVWVGLSIVANGRAYTRQSLS